MHTSSFWVKFVLIINYIISIYSPLWVDTIGGVLMSIHNPSYHTTSHRLKIQPLNEISPQFPYFNDNTGVLYPDSIFIFSIDNQIILIYRDSEYK